MAGAAVVLAAVAARKHSRAKRKPKPAKSELLAGFFVLQSQTSKSVASQHQQIKIPMRSVAIC